MPTTSSYRRKPEINILDKRIPRNPKYQNVRPTINTGWSLTKFLERQEELRASAKQLSGEIFKRMKISTLIQLIIQVAEINSLESASRDEFASASQRTFTDRSRPETQDTEMSGATTRSTLQSVIRGVGEMDTYRNHTSRSSTVRQRGTSNQTDLEYEERPYLIVDLRDIDEFRTNHIVSAHHYPAAMLSRCTNNDSKELLAYKNQKGKIIIIYDEDERIAPYAATIMVERGYNNIFMLSGGLQYALRKFPRGLLTGTCPLSWTLSNVPLAPIRKSKHAEQPHIPFNEPPLGQSAASMTRPAPGPAVRFPNREQFTNQDIEELNAQLEINSLARDNATRLSGQRTDASKQCSRVSHSTQRSNFTNISDQPWKP